MMRKTALSMALAMLAFSTAATAGDYGLGIKFGAGGTLGNINNQARTSIQMAVTGYKTMGEGRELFAELQYRDFRATQYEATKFVNGVTLTNSVDSRRDALEGLAVAVGYRMPVLTEGLSVQGGLHLSALKSRQEVLGVLLRGVAGREENLALTPAKTQMAPGLFVGAQYQLTKDFFVEANLTHLRYQDANHVPAAYSGQAATTEYLSRSKTVLELSAGFRF